MSEKDVKDSVVSEAEDSKESKKTETEIKSEAKAEAKTKEAKTEEKPKADKKESKADEAKNKKNDKKTKAKTNWFKGLKAEFSKIIWPDKQTLAKESTAVLIVSVILGVIIAAVDFIARVGIEFIVK